MGSLYLIQVGFGFGFDVVGFGWVGLDRFGLVGFGWFSARLMWCDM